MKSSLAHENDNFEKKILRIIKDGIMFYGRGGTFFYRVFEVALTSTIVSDFFMPRDYSQEGGIKICPCLSLCLSVRSSHLMV